MEIPGLYSPKVKLQASSFFNSRLPDERQAQQLGAWRTWSGTECARFIADVCNLPQYGDVAERNLSGRKVDELLQAGLLSKGLAKIGIGDFDHVQQITAAIQKLDFGARLGISLGSSGNSLWTSSIAPRRKSFPTLSLTKSMPTLPKMKNCKPKLLEQVLEGFDRSLPEYQRRLTSPKRLSLPKLESNKWTVPNVCPVVVPISASPINYVFAGRHSPTVTHMRKPLLNRASSEGAMRAPYWTSSRSSPQPWAQDDGLSELAQTRNAWDALQPEAVASNPHFNHKDSVMMKHDQLRDDLVAKMQFLSQVPLLNPLPKSEMPILASRAIRKTFVCGETIIREGEPGNEFYVIVNGDAEVVRGGRVVGMLHSGDYFGEKALLYDERRAATVTADTDLECLELHRDRFRELGLHTKLQFANRKAILCGERPIVTNPPSPKSPEERKLITAALQKNAHVQNLLTLGSVVLDRMVDAAWREDVAEGTVMIKHGDLHADRFYVVESGSFEVHLPAKVQEKRQTLPHNLNWALHADALQHSTSIGPKGSFGELALLYSAPRAATVKAATKGLVWVIDGKSFKSIMKQDHLDTTKNYIECLDRVDLLSSLYKDEKEALAEALVEMQFEKGQALLESQESSKAFYILYDGEVSVTVDGKFVSKLTASPTAQSTHVFGEQSLLPDGAQIHQAVHVTSACAKVLALDRDSFAHLLGPLQDLMKGIHRGIRPNLDPFQFRSASEDAAVSPGKGSGTILRKDLRKCALLGCGAFAMVHLVQHINTGATYALKAVSKGYALESSTAKKLTNEKAIMMMVDSPFIIHLRECYNGKQFIYFLMDVALGGDLYAAYTHHGLSGSAVHTRFYSASVLYALEYLHERHIIYRDLKPENLLLTPEGHMKVTDMGLSKFVLGKTYTCCGTPDYLSPEMIHGVGHTNATDWWAFGVLLFELMTGHPPFQADSIWETCAKVNEGTAKVWFPPESEGIVGDLICNMLEHEPHLRLAMRPGGTQNVKSHPWYADFDWTALKKQIMTTPLKPILKSDMDTSNFDDLHLHLPTQLPYVDDGSGWDCDFATVNEPDYPESEPPEEHIDAPQEYEFEFADLDDIFTVDERV